MSEYERGRRDMREEIRNALICDQATGAGDYSEAEEYANRIVGKATENLAQGAQDELGNGLLLEKVALAATSGTPAPRKCQRCGAELSGASSFSVCNGDCRKPAQPSGAQGDGLEVLLSKCARAIEEGFKEKGIQPPAWLFGDARYRLRTVLAAARKPAAPTKCPRCEGTGKYRRAPWDADTDCAVCDGHGMLDENGRGAATSGTPAPRCSLIINLSQTKALLKMFDEQDTEITLDNSTGKLLAWLTEYPEEGSTELIAPAAPPPAGETLPAPVCDKVMHLYVWTRTPSFYAVAQASNVAEAREALLEEIGSTGDGSCPEREAAAKWVSSQTPAIWHHKNAEFALTDSAELHENELLVEKLQKELKAAQPSGAQGEGLRAPIGDLIAYHEKEAKNHVSSQWIYGNHMMAVQAYKKVLGMLATLAAAREPAAPASGTEGRE